MDKVRQLLTDVKKITDEILSEKRGRPSSAQPGRSLRPIENASTVRIKILKTLMRWNTSQTHRMLTSRDSTFRKICQIRLSDIPPRRTLAYRLTCKSVIAFQRRLHSRLIGYLINKRNARVLLCDMSELTADSRDCLADGGFCSKGWFHGYKVHLTTTVDGIPLGVVVTRASLVEQTVGKRLVRRVERQLSSSSTKACLYWVADAGYDGEPMYQVVADEFGAQLICAPNPRRDKDLCYLRRTGQLTDEKKRQLANGSKRRDKGLLLYVSKKGKDLYSRRIAVEQTIDTLKLDLSRSEIPYWVKGVRKLSRWVEDHLLTLVSVIFCNKLHRRQLRQTACYLL